MSANLDNKKPEFIQKPLMVVDRKWMPLSEVFRIMKQYNCEFPMEAQLVNICPSVKSSRVNKFAKGSGW